MGAKKPLVGQTKELEECETALRSLGMDDQEIAELGETIDVIGDKIFDNYTEALYER